MPSAVPIADPPCTDQTGPDAVGVSPVRTVDGRPATANDRHFCTAHLHDDLKGRSVRGGAVTLGAQGIKFTLQLVQTVVLARLLAPEAFGLVAMVTAVTGFVAMFKDAGLSMATVQREHITHEQVSTLFWINVGLSAVLAVLVAVLAPALAWLYGDPRLTAITLVLAGTFILSGLAIQHGALLRRQMRFTALAVIQIITMTAGVVVAITAAVLGAGYWALVVMSIVSSVVGTVLVWGVSGWMPGLPRRRSGVRGMLRFGGGLTAAGALNYLGGTFDKILLGWAFGPTTLGFYDRAYRLVTLPMKQVNAPLAAVATTALSRTNNKPDNYRSGYLTTIQNIAFFAWPLILWLMACSDDLMLIVLGPGWDEAADAFLILGFASLVLPIWNSTGWLFVSQARIREHLHFHILDSTGKIASVLIGIPWGLTGVCIAVAARYYMIAPILFWIVGRRGPVTTSDFYRTLTAPALTAIAVGFGLLLCADFGLGGVSAIGIKAAVAFTFAIAAMLLIPAGRNALVNAACLLRRQISHVSHSHA